MELFLCGNLVRMGFLVGSCWMKLLRIGLEITRNLEKKIHFLCAYMWMWFKCVKILNVRIDTSIPQIAVFYFYFQRIVRQMPFDFLGIFGKMLKKFVCKTNWVREINGEQNKCKCVWLVTKNRKIIKHIHEQLVCVCV